ncbi:MAG TPA: hypothetical protein VJV78_28530, partial [Polyangiales bacterium]|nr:hypothetical protein [Polyangiales bacterium]
MGTCSRRILLVCVLIAACSPADDAGRVTSPDTAPTGAGGRGSAAGSVSSAAGRAAPAGVAGNV